MFPMAKRNRWTEKNAQKWFDWRHNDVNLLNVDEMNNDNEMNEMNNRTGVR